jgi:hypothetical protein
MDIQPLLYLIVSLLLVAIILLAVILRTLSSGVNRILDAVGSIYFECNYPQEDSPEVEP